MPDLFDEIAAERANTPPQKDIFDEIYAERNRAKLRSDIDSSIAESDAANVVGPAESFGREFVRAGSGLVQTANEAVSVIPNLADWAVYGATGGSYNPQLTEKYENLVGLPALRESRKDIGIQPEETQSTASKIAGMAGNAAYNIPLAVGLGGASGTAIPAISGEAFLPNAARGVAAMIPMAQEAGQDVRAQGGGVTPQLTAQGVTLASGVIPFNIGSELSSPVARFASRAAQNTAIAVPTNAVMRQANQIASGQQIAPLESDDVISAIPQAILGGIVGPGRIRSPQFDAERMLASGIPDEIISPKYEAAKAAASADLPATAEVLARQGDEEISLTKTGDIFDEIAQERTAESVGTTAPEEQPDQPIVTEEGTAAPIIESAVTSDVPLSEVTQPEIVNESSKSNPAATVESGQAPIPDSIQSAIESLPRGEGEIGNQPVTTDIGTKIPKIEQAPNKAVASEFWDYAAEQPNLQVDITSSRKDPNRITLENIFVDEDARGEGVGRNALKRLTDLADKHGVTIDLDVADEAGIGTVDWYARNGFKWAPGGSYMIREPKENLVTETQTKTPNETEPTTQTAGQDLARNPQEDSTGISQEERNQADQQVAEIAPTGEEGASLVNENILEEQRGPGAANIGEFAEMPIRTTSLSNAQTNAERAARGELPLILEETQSNQSTFDQAESILEKNPNAGRDTVVRILEGDKPQISEIDEGILAHEKIRLENEKTQEAERASDPYSSEIEREQAAKRWEELELQQTQLDQAVRRAGTIAGRALQFRQRQIRDDFTLASMEQKTRVAKGRPLTPEESAELKVQADEIAKQQAIVDESEVRIEAEQREKALESTLSDLKKKLAQANSKGPKLDKRVLEYADKIVKGWETAATAASQRLKERLRYAGSAPDPTILLDLTIIARAKIGRGLIKAGNFISDVVGEYGEVVRPYAQQAWDAAQAELDNIATELPKIVRDKVKKAIVNTPEAIVNRITDTIKERLAEGGDLASLKGLVDRFALEFVRKGVDKRDALLDSVHAVLEPLIPDITKQQTSDLISGYGQFKTLDKEAAKVTLRGLKGELQQIAKIQDMQAKLAPKKTGIERRTPTTEERTLIRQVNDLKKKGGFEVTDPERQLKTSLGAIQTRLRNEIDDFDNAILNKEPIVRENGKIDYDDETKALQAQRDAKKAEYDELFPKAPQTEEQQIATAIKSIDRSISELQQNLKEGKLYSVSKKNTLTHPELVAKRAQLEALREERENLRNLDTATLETKKESQLLKAIDDVEKGVKQPNTGVDTVESKRITELKEQLQKLRDARNETPEARQKQIDKSLAIAKKSLEDYNQRLVDNDLVPRKGKEPLRSDELDDVRMERDAVAAMIRELQEAANPKKTPEEIALQNYKARAAQRISDMQERIARGDFDPKERVEVKLDAEGRKAEFELNQMKKKFNEARHNDMLKKRPLPKKIFHGLRDVLNTARAVMTSFDVSAVLRQGGFVSLGNPARMAKNIGPMFRALRSEKNRFEIDKSIWERPNAPLYRQSKLAIVDPNETNMNKQEEAYMGRWAQKLPGVGASERAYTTYLNLLRADTFDALHAALSRDGAMIKQESDAIADYINVATGRGNLAGASGTAASLNSLFFSPRLMVSRFEMLAGAPLMKGSMRTRQAIAKEYAKFLVAAGIVSSLALGAGASIETDPRSSDFMKFRFGDTRLDPWGGLVQVAVLMSRLASGKKKTLSGNVQNIRATETEKIPFGGEDAWDLTGRFLRTKLNPALGAAVDIVSGSNVVGQPVDPKMAVVKTVVPLTIQDIKQTMEDQGVVAGTAESLLSLLGVGMQTFESREEQKAKDLQLSSQLQ